MDQLFLNAATAEQPKRLVITSNWLGTLSDVCWNDFDLLQFLSDAKKGGQRVIITPDSDMDLVPFLLEALTELGRQQGYDLINADQYELISRGAFETMNVAVDYSFDGDATRAQKLSDGFAGRPKEIQALSETTKTLISIDKLRILCGLSQKNGGTEHVVPGPSL